MEIKVGDKVRIANDAPAEYRYGFNYRLRSQVSEVIGLDDEGFMAAILPLCVNDKDLWFQIPTKYLIKVDAVAKEAKFKKGDRVKYVGKEHPEYWGEIFTVDGEIFYNDYHKNMQIDSIRCEKYNVCNVPLSDLTPYTEPTAPTIEVGDRVCCYNVLHLKGSKKEDYMGYVTSITDMGITIQLDKGGLVLVYHESDLERVEPKEQTEAEEDTRIRQMEAELDEFRKAELDRVLHPEKYHTYEVTIDNVAVNWQRYEADLAKEIAVKSMEKSYGCDPERIAEYAVSVAKAVVENLKKK